MNEIARKVLVAEENGVTKIFFDENLYKVNKEELTKLSAIQIPPESQTARQKKP